MNFQNFLNIIVPDNLAAAVLFSRDSRKCCEFHLSQYEMSENSNLIFCIEWKAPSNMNSTAVYAFKFVNCNLVLTIALV